MFIVDEGKDYTWMLRKLRRDNRIYLTAADGSHIVKNSPLVHLIEDISFRNSKHSLFIQAADFCAYALLRREKPLASKTKYGIDKSFLNLKPIMVREANNSDFYGIIRA